MDQKLHPFIEKRRFRLKNPKLKFFCPLCRIEREMNYSSRLEMRHYIQIVFISLCLIVLSFSLMSAWSIVFLFITWAGFEGVRRSLFKKEIPCPHCGFDATWYKKDVKIARQKVSEFWRDKVPLSAESDSLELEESESFEVASENSFDQDYANQQNRESFDSFSDAR